jgi:hypothetical protein
LLWQRGKKENKDKEEEKKRKNKEKIKPKFLEKKKVFPSMMRRCTMLVVYFEDGNVDGDKV